MEQNENNLECVIRVNTGFHHEPAVIHVYPGDNGKDLCNNFCKMYKITDRARQIAL